MEREVSNGGALMEGFDLALQVRGSPTEECCWSRELQQLNRQGTGEHPRQKAQTHHGLIEGGSRKGEDGVS